MKTVPPEAVKASTRSVSNNHVNDNKNNSSDLKTGPPEATEASTRSESKNNINDNKTTTTTTATT